MAGGILKVIEDLEKKAVNFVEEEVEGSDKKSVYSERFKGEVLGKHDPYDEDNGDHEVQASESAVSKPSHNAEWFSAVKGAGKTKPVAAPSPSVAGAKADGPHGSNPDAVAKATKSESKAGEKGVQAKGVEASSGDKDPSVAGAKADGPHGSNPDAVAKVTKEGLKPGAQNVQAKGADTNGGDKDPSVAGAKADGLHGSNVDAASKITKEGSKAGEKGVQARAVGTTRQVDGRKKDSNSNRDDSQSPEIPEIAETPEDNPDLDAEDKSPKELPGDTSFDRKAPSLIADLDRLAAQGKKAKMQKETLRGVRRTLEEPHKLYKDPERLSVTRSGDPDELRHSLKRYGRSVAPKDDADPHDISADPEKLKDIRANPNKAIRGMIDLGQQYGKDPFDGIDPADVQEIIEHHAAEHPHRKHNTPYVPVASAADDFALDEDDPEAPSRDASSDDEESEGEESSEYPKLDEVQNLDPDHSSDADVLEANSQEKKSLYLKSYSNDDSTSSSDPSAGDSADDEDDDSALDEDDSDSSSNDDSSDDRSSTGDSSGDDSTDDAESDGEEYLAYPKLDEAQDLDPDDPSNAEGIPPKRKKKKRLYPTPYSDNDHPNDLQLACDALSEMVSAADSDEDSPSDDEDTPLHKKKAHAAKKVLKCLNRVRSFQQDPAACEGAFVDEASEEGAEIAGLSPDEIERQYYALKEVSTRYKQRMHRHASDTDDESDSDMTDEEGNTADVDAFDDSSDLADDDESNSEMADIDESEPEDDHPHKKTKHHIHRVDAYDGGSVEKTRYSSNVFINGGGDYEEDETPDIEMSLPENQFPDTVVSEDETSEQDSSEDEDSSDSGDSSDPVSQIGGLLSGVLSGNTDVSAIAGDVANLEGAAESIEGAVGAISKVEGELSEVESLGSEASSASSKIKGLKGAKANYASMINLCSNPIDNVTEAENVLSGISNLAQNPDAVINQAESLINAGQQGMNALVNAKSPEGAFAAVLGMATQLNGGGDGGDSSDDGDSDSSEEGSDSDDSDDPDSSSAEGGSEDDDPAEFANADMYGDE
ncbi:MAG: hypothetical protein Q8Q56_00480 [Alphaproteobacteria bacterium]|nr:hypothetical protein [Alphaproteobacteria bacterium]